jgi:hypothetical protein
MPIFGQFGTLSWGMNIQKSCNKFGVLTEVVFWGLTHSQVFLFKSNSDLIYQMGKTFADHLLLVGSSNHWNSLAITVKPDSD